MKKALVLTSLGALAALSFGCVLTDYPNMPVQNKSHGLIGCSTNDRIANAQQTVEGGTRELLYTTTFGGPSLGGNCTTGFDPGVSLNNVSSQDARDWNRFNANWCFFGETQVFGVPGGTWVLAGVKDLADGATRIDNLYTANTGAFSCVGDRVDGRYGGPEGVVFADEFGRLPGLRIDTIAIDHTSTTTEFCPNIAAVHPEAAANAFSTYWGQLARAYEGSLAATPITRRANLANLLNNGTESITFEGVTATGRGQLNADGSWTLELLSLQNGQASYQAETPVKFTANPANHFKTWKIENANETEMVKLAQFGLDSGLAGHPISLAGKQIPEFGYTFGDVEFLVNPSALQQFVDAHSAPGDGLGN
jgi:hypothetical protein